jgi:hypothetical protein
VYPGEANLWTDNDARNQVRQNQGLLEKLGNEREGSRDYEYNPDVGEKAMLIHRKIITAKPTKSEWSAPGCSPLYLHRIRQDFSR